jgi:hypothetical protein
LLDVRIPRIENFREANEIPDSPAILFMDNCSGHVMEPIVGLLLAHKIKILTLPPHSSGIFQMLDLVFFGVSKSIKKRLAQEGLIPVMADHVMRMFKAVKRPGRVRQSEYASFGLNLSITRFSMVATL